MDTRLNGGTLTSTEVAQRQVAVLKAWLHDEELPEGELETALPWLSALLWETFGGAEARLPGEVSPRSPPESATRSGKRGWACYNIPLSSTLGLTGEAEEDPDALPAGHVWGLTNSHAAVVIDCPMENAFEIDFPFDAAMVELHWPEDNSWKRTLIEVTRDELHARFNARGNLSELFPDVTSHRLADAELYLWSIAPRPEVYARVSDTQLTDLMRKTPENARLQEFAKRKAEAESRSNGEE
jgi:hypothetical protein